MVYELNVIRFSSTEEDDTCPEGHEIPRVTTQGKEFGSRHDMVRGRITSARICELRLGYVASLQMHVALGLSLSRCWRGVARGAAAL